MTEPQTATSNTKRPYRTEEQWRQLIEEHEAGDLSVDKFCTQNNLKRTTFYKWRKRLLQESIPLSTPPAFIELPVAKTTPVQQSTWDIELELGSGVVLRLRSAESCG